MDPLHALVERNHELAEEIIRLHTALADAHTEIARLMQVVYPADSRRTWSKLVAEREVET